MSDGVWTLGTLGAPVNFHYISFIIREADLLEKVVTEK